MSSRFVTVLPTESYTAGYRERKLPKRVVPPYTTIRHMLIVERKSYREIGEACGFSGSRMYQAFRAGAIERGEWERMKERQAQATADKRRRRMDEAYYINGRAILDMVREHIETGPYEGDSFMSRSRDFCARNGISHSNLRHRIISTEVPMTKSWAQVLLKAIGEPIPSELKKYKPRKRPKETCRKGNGPASKAVTG